MNNKIAVITGATGGIGRIVCKYLIDKGYIVYAAYRSTRKRDELRNYIAQIKGAENLNLLPADLKSFTSVREFCSKIVESIHGDKIDILINNAGVIAPLYEITEDGYESSMQVNYLSARLITETLLPHISGKIINTVSCSITKGECKKPEKKSVPEKHSQSTIASLKHYSNSKLMLALYTVALHREVGMLHNDTINPIAIYGADPGIVNTSIISMHRWYDPIADLIFRPFIKSPEQGAKPLINAIEHNHTANDKMKSHPLLFAGNGTKEFPKKIKNIL